MLTVAPALGSVTCHELLSIVLHLVVTVQRRRQNFAIDLELQLLVEATLDLAVQVFLVQISELVFLLLIEDFLFEFRVKLA